MPDLLLRYYPDESLRTKCIPFSNDLEERTTVASEMVAIMYSHDGFGLAANQVGLNQRVFVMRSIVTPEIGICLFNPIIISTGKDMITEEEGCLSLLSKRVKINRFKEIEVQFEGVDGSIYTEKYTDLHARCVQHEIDHLNGILIFDHIRGNLAQKIFLEKYAKLKRKSMIE